MQRHVGTRRYKRMAARDPKLLAGLRVKKSGLNQVEFAEHLGIGVATLARAERGENIVKSSADLIAEGLKKPVEELFVHISVTVKEPSLVGRPQVMPFALRPDIQEFRERNRLGITVVDEFLELHHSPSWRGWRYEEVEFEEIGEYEPPADFEAFLERYKTQFNRSYYSLCGFGPLPTADDEQDLAVFALGGSYHHVYALTQVFENQQNLEDCRKFRRRCEDSLLPITNSPLYFNINCEVVVVTADDRIVVARRRLSSPFFAGAWTASLEEQMLRWDPKPDAQFKKDAGLFECAERGAMDELGITISPTKPTLLLSVGIEWRNFTAAFVFVIHANETFATIRDELWPRAHDRNEAIALDCTATDPGVLRQALSSSDWSPTSAAIGDPIVGKEAASRGIWHPTARARLEAYLQHRITVR